MTRSFSADPVPPDLLRSLLDTARRAPSAGHTQGTELLVLIGPEQTGRYWAATLDEDARSRFAFPGLLRAPVLVVVYVRPDAYAERYRQADKVAVGRADLASWPQPFWTVDGAFVALNLQLAAVDAGLGALFFGVFDHAPAVAAEFAVPPDREVLGTVALGWPDGAEPRPGRSAGRGWRPLDEVVHYGEW
jgi:nitroreductase